MPETIEQLKARLRRALAAASAKHPGGEMPELIAAVEALLDRTLLGRLAPEVRGAKVSFGGTLTVPARCDPMGSSYDWLRRRRRS